MVKFSEIEYIRPSMEALEQSFREKINTLKSANNPGQTIDAIKAINQLRSEFDTMSSVANVRYSINTRDSKYEAERQFFDENQPDYSFLTFEFYQAVLASPFRQAIEKQFGGHYLRLLELRSKTFSQAIMPGLKEENKYRTQYVKLMSGIEFDFEGEKRNLGAMAPFMQSADRNMRKKAAETYYGALYAEKDDLDNIYHNLVQTRHKLALDQGYKDFVKMSYHRLLRYDYGPEEVAAFRELVQKHLIPISNKLRERQAKRIGVDKLKHYDEPLKFLEGNPTPKGSPEWILETGRQMYKELSPETHEFFESMVKADMMDLVNRSGKQGGGYCTYFPTYGSPFIFSNFNGTAHDVEVLTHEAGHAFQVYSSKDQPLNEYWWPTLESAEIHSMSMEFFTWPWMKNFFGEDTDRFMFDHIASSMTFIPYGCSIDHFQELVFRNPGDSPEERLERWKQVEKIYAPMKDNDGNPFLEEGRYWQRQGHVYRSPFYYIDYTLAQICAFQFWIKSRKDFNAAWKDYLRLCRAGGSKPFLQLLDIANLDSPFEESTMLRVAEEVNAWLDSTSID